MNANDQLKEYYGTEAYHRFNNKCLLTDGALAMAEKFKCYWLLDIIASYQSDKLDKEADGMQVWKLKVKDEQGNVTCTDGNYKLLRSQTIPLTDFEANEAELWVEPLDQFHRVILLPSEH